MGLRNVFALSNKDHQQQTVVSGLWNAQWLPGVAHESIAGIVRVSGQLLILQQAAKVALSWFQKLTAVFTKILKHVC